MSSRCIVTAKDYEEHGFMSSAEDYRPCRNCGELTDSGCCSPRCADELEQAAQFQRRLTAGEIDEDGNELGDWCIWCGAWFPYIESLGPYCAGICAVQAGRD